MLAGKSMEKKKKKQHYFKVTNSASYQPNMLQYVVEFVSFVTILLTIKLLDCSRNIKYLSAKSGIFRVFNN